MPRWGVGWLSPIGSRLPPPPGGRPGCFGRVLSQALPVCRALWCGSPRLCRARDPVHVASTGGLTLHVLVTAACRELGGRAALRGGVLRGLQPHRGRGFWEKSGQCSADRAAVASAGHLPGGSSRRGGAVPGGWASAHLLPPPGLWHGAWHLLFSGGPHAHSPHPPPGLRGQGQQRRSLRPDGPQPSRHPSNSTF